MIVLAIDTCGASGSIALGRLEHGTATVLAQIDLAGKSYSAQLVPAVRDLLSKQGLEVVALDALVVVNGPGSFTGVRIGVSAAKGFAEALDIPIVAVSRLAVMAWAAGTESAALDAGRGEFYFRHGSREFLLSAKEIPQLDPGALAVCEAGALSVFPDASLTDPPTAGDALIFASPQLADGEFADVSTLDGNYLRRSDAELFAKTTGKV